MGAQGSAGLGIQERSSWVFPKWFRGGFRSTFESMFSETMIYVMPELFLETKGLYKMSRNVRNRSGALGILCYRGRRGTGQCGPRIRGALPRCSQKVSNGGPDPPKSTLSTT